jgi:hypothetical protein
MIKMTHTMIPRTNYLMEQEPSLIQAQAGGDGGWYCWQDKMAEKEKKGPPGPCSGSSCSRYSMSRTMWASRHDLLVIPRYQASIAYAFMVTFEFW